MPRPATRRNPADGPTPPERKWIGLLKEWQKTGLQGSEWCRRRGLKESAFRFWKKEITLRARKRQGRRSQNPSSVRLLPARVVEAAISVTVVPLEIVLGRRSVRVAVEFDATILRKVVRALEDLS